MAVPADVVKSGQVLWRSLLLDVSAPAAEPKVWIDSDDDVVGLGAGAVDLGLLDRTRGATVTRARTPHREISVLVHADTLAAQATVRAAMTPSVVPEPLVWLGHGASARQVVWAVPAGVDEVSTPAGDAGGFARMLLRFVAGDPRRYSEAETEKAGGLSTAATLPNAGDAPSPLRASIAGAVSAPRLRQTNVGAWRWPDLSLTSGQTLEVDFRARTAVVVETGEDPVSVWGQAVDDSNLPPLVSWMEVPAGGGSFSFASTSGTSSASVFTRSAWA